MFTSACSSIVQALYVNTFVFPETISFTLKESVAHHLHMCVCDISVTLKSFHSIFKIVHLFTSDVLIFTITKK